MEMQNSTERETTWALLHTHTHTHTLIAVKVALTLIEKEKVRKQTTFQRETERTAN